MNFPYTDSNSSINLPEFKILPVGIFVGDRQGISNSLIKGLEDGKEAINFDNWLIPFSDVMEALKFKVTPQSDGSYEIRSFGLITRIKPEKLVIDDYLGQALSVSQIRELLETEVKFNLREYAIILQPSWQKGNITPKYAQPDELPVIIEGLPKINASWFKISGFNQKTDINDTNTSGFPLGSENFNYNLQFNVIGTLFDGSWLFNAKQFNSGNNGDWEIDELQYFRPQPDHDLLIGTQTPFWTYLDRDSQPFLGFSLIKRFDYIPQNNSNFSDQGINSRQRLNSGRVEKTLKGKAKPGTLVQLVTERSNLLVDQVLVDDSGEYQFENVVTLEKSFGGVVRNINYQLYLYPDGNLAKEPEIIKLTYRNFGGQINEGKSGLIFSVGAERNSSNDNIFGELGDIQTGVSYYWGINDEITLGTGAVYDDSLKSFTEIFYQPTNFPLTFRVGALSGENIDFNGDISYNTPNFRLSFSGNEQSQSFNSTWRVNRNVALFSRWTPSNDNLIDTGINLNFRPWSASLTYNTKNELNWDLKYSLNPLSLSLRQRKDRFSSEFIYNLSGESLYSTQGHALRLTYDSDDQDYLTSLNWFYRSPFKTQDGRSLLDFELGYGIGSQGNGLIASAFTSLVPGLGLRLTYRETSLNSSTSSITLGFVTNMLFESGLKVSADETSFQRLRTQGGIFLQAYFDQNNNGKLDNQEKLYNQDLDLIFRINNQSIEKISLGRPEKTKNGFLAQLEPQTYRLDIDPAGLPLGWKSRESAYAVEVVPGSYTKVKIPLIPSYTLAGFVFDAQNKPVGGAKVEVIPVSQTEPKVISITNNGGIYYLENLAQGEYQIFIDGKPANPSNFIIKEDSPVFQELNLSFSDF